MSEDRETCFADTPRIKGKPFVKRIGENRLERDSEGHVIEYFGYYSKAQQRAREIWTQNILQIIKSHGILMDL